MSKGNVFDAVPALLDSEVFDDIVTSDNVRIERIVSKGHTSPDTGWYDQNENEWVMVLQGRGSIAFDDGTEVSLGKGDYVTIRAHRRHKVTWTDPDAATLWLAVFYQ
ncbi:MAG: cupin domain-containing protein [Chromatiaceae bacterium]|nr:cupin domain-containing protein [Chromatiaceae bacterium]MCP5315828.1 cupin domain-containing protein [Chromatiaceae bacterium]